MPSLTAWIPPAAVTLLLVLVGVVGLAAAVVRLLDSGVRGRDPGAPFVDEVVGLVVAGQVDEAIARCVAVRSPIADVALVVLRSRVRDEGDLHGLAEAARLSVLPALGRGNRWIPALAAGMVALGGAGTAIGIQHAWHSGHSPEAEALDPLVFGLLVAALLGFLHGWIGTRASRAEARIAELTARLINVLRDRPDVRLGHR